jgi:RNA polymerase sigma-70 factor (ECF subfamily)
VRDPQLEAFFRANFAIIHAKCVRMLGEGEEAADVAQETFVRLCETGFVHREPAVRAAWMYRASTRLAVDRLRRRALGVETRCANAEPADGPADHDLEASVHARRALATLAASADPRELEVAILCRLDGLTQAEAAEVLDVSERTVRRRLERFDAQARREGGVPR